MLNIIFWTAMGIPTSYIICDIIDHNYNLVYNRRISDRFKYNIMTSIIVLSFLRGYTGSDLITNIYGCIL